MKIICDALVILIFILAICPNNRHDVSLIKAIYMYDATEHDDEDDD